MDRLQIRLLHRLPELCWRCYHNCRPTHWLIPETCSCKSVGLWKNSARAAIWTPLPLTAPMYTTQANIRWSSAEVNHTTQKSICSDAFRQRSAGSIALSRGVIVHGQQMRFQNLFKYFLQVDVSFFEDGKFQSSYRLSSCTFFFQLYYALFTSNYN